MEFKNILIIILILLLILLIFRINYQNYNIENFNDGILTQKIIKKQIDNYNINIWSNKIKSLASNGLETPLSFWEPNLQIPNDTSIYFKIGDTISTKNDYSKPDHNIIAVSGDIIHPTKYEKIIEIQNPELDNLSYNDKLIYKELFGNLTNFNEIDKIKKNINDIINILNNFKDELKQKLKLKVLENWSIYLIAGNDTKSVYSNCESLSSNKQLWNNFLKYNTANYTCNLTYNSNNTYYRQADIKKISYNNFKDNSYKFDMDLTNNFNIYRLIAPFGFSFYTTKDNLKINSKLTDDEYSTTINIPLNQTSLSLPSENTVTKIGNTKIGINNKILIQPITLKFTDAISENSFNNIFNTNIDILEKMGLINVAKKITEYQLFLNNLLNNNYIVYNLFYNNISSDKLTTGIYPSLAGLNNNKLNITIDSNLQNYISQKIDKININWDLPPSLINQYDKLTHYFQKIIEFIDNFKNKGINDLPLTIYRPIINNPNYIVLGDIILDDSKKISNYIDFPILAAVPINCVHDIRDWRSTDMIYEYQNKNNDIYFSIFFNPYLGTFKTVTVKGNYPNGRVQKLVACVEGCKSVDNIIKYHQCAKQIQRQNKNIMDKTPLIGTNVLDEQNNYYLEKLGKRQNNINTLKTGVEIIQNINDRVNSINKADSRANLQKYIDKQKENINTITDKLINDSGKIKANVNIPKDFSLPLVNLIINKINESNIPNKQNLIDKFMKLIKDLKTNVITKTEMQNKLDILLSQCPNIDPMLIKKQLVNQLCVGCNI